MNSAGRLSPVQVECLLAFYYYAHPVRDWVKNSPSREAAEEFHKNIGAIRHSCITTLGRAWVEEILRTPVPVLAYINNHGEVIDVD